MLFDRDFKEVSIPYSTIKIQPVNRDQVFFHMFQFLIVRLKFFDRIEFKEEVWFQFLIVRLKFVKNLVAIFHKKFQFLIVRLKFV